MVDESFVSGILSAGEGQARTGQREHRENSQWAWRLIWPFALFFCFVLFVCFLLLLSLIFYIYAFSMYQSDHFLFCLSIINHNSLNHKSVSLLDWQHCAIRISSRLFCATVKRFRTEPMRGLDERGERPEEAVKCSNITDLFRASSAGQFHL